MTNQKHYHNIDREPHVGDRVRLAAGLGAAIPVDGNDLAKAGNGWPSRHELVQPWWDVDAKPGAQRKVGGNVWTKQHDGTWGLLEGLDDSRVPALELEKEHGPGELVTPEPESIPEPTSRTAVAVGKVDGKNVVASRMGGRSTTPWATQEASNDYFVWRSWTDLCDRLTDIRVVDVAEPRPTKVANCARCDRIEAHSLGNEALLARRREQLAKAKDEINQLKARIAELEVAKPTPGPWLRGDELEAVMPTLKAGDVVEVEHRLHGKFSGDLASFGDAALALAGWHIRNSAGNKMRWLDALRVIDRAPEPEPGADIPDEVVDEALDSFMDALEDHERPKGLKVRNFMRAALAAADAKRAEVEEEA